MASTQPQGARWVGALLFITALSGCNSTPDEPAEAGYPQIVASSFGEMRNVSVTGSIWIGAAPSVADLELARRRGITRVIDLSTSAEKMNCDVAAACEAQGIDYYMAALNPSDLERDSCVDLVLEWLTYDSSGPTLMFDGSGGRCASYLAIYRAVVLGVPLEDALVEARRAGMKPGAPEEFVRAQYARLTTSRPEFSSATNRP